MTLDVAKLARFDGGLSWSMIFVIDGRQPKTGQGLSDPIAAWWRDFVGDAEDAGLLRWEKGKRNARGRWCLTDEGRELVRTSARGRA